MEGIALEKQTVYNKFSRLMIYTNLYFIELVLF
jgi:hypothetical protein